MEKKQEEAISDAKEVDLKNYSLNKQDELTEDQKLMVKRYLRKVDIRILPIVILLYVFSLIDRGNIGAALVSGMNEYLHLNTVQQGNSTTFFYIFYLIFETPANVLLKKTKPHYWFGFLGSAWSISCMALAFAKTPTIFIILRGCLGAFESGLTPGVVGYLHYWYTRSEVASRMTMFFIAVPVSGVIGSPITAALASKDLGPFKPFQAIFFVEGLITLVIAIVLFFVLIDYPDQAKFFTPEERELILKRLNTEQGMASTTKPSFKQTLKIMSDWKLYVNALIFFGLNTVATVTGIFNPTLLKISGYSGTTAIYMGTVGSILGVIGVLITLRLVNRVPFYMLLCSYAAISVVFYAVAAFSNGKILRFIFLSIAGFGSSPNIAIPLTWASINTGGVYKGLISSAIVISIGSIPGVIFPRLFTSNYAPKFLKGQLSIIISGASAIVLALIMAAYYRAENKRRDENPVDLSHMPIEEQRLLNDLHPDFRYKL
ncbi:hypothetical protein BB558_004753 [Smittium angustum]|uniref:Major facilitator superfamily (MFS) profile domain-containing protein n=1 Tax=Smittium angustum TaxID=133377 RepID=A0A2U1J2F6_SMIAN|nr:hypothetical protein BB558_004753 [Smittium angustum]